RRCWHLRHCRHSPDRPRIRLSQRIGLMISRLMVTLRASCQRIARWHDAFMTSKALLTTFAYLSVCTGFSQNRTLQCSPEKIMIDSLFYMISNQQSPQAFALYESLIHSEFEPRAKLSIAIEAYKEKNESVFKSVLLDLMANHGFVNDNSTQGVLFSTDITSGIYAEWFNNVKDSCKFVYEKTHFQRKEVIETLKRIYERDQSRGEIYRTITDEKLADSIVMALDETNFQELLLISKSYGLPNGFDDVYNAGGIVELVLLHCSKNPSGFQDRWDAIMPFINQIFDLDKGSNGFTYIYDMTSRLHFGV